MTSPFRAKCIVILGHSFSMMAPMQSGVIKLTPNFSLSRSATLIATSINISRTDEAVSQREPQRAFADSQRCRVVRCIGASEAGCSAMKKHAWVLLVGELVDRHGGGL